MPVASAPPAPPRAAREFDLVVYGATGFTGALAIDYLARTHPRVKIAVAGRDDAKLRARADATARARGVTFPTLVARDDASREAMVRRARTVLTFAGPYDGDDARALARSCAENGTDYCDISGEPAFVRDVVEACHERAKATGCALVSCVGYDSAPWDLGAALACEATMKRGGATEIDVARGHAGRSRGGVSGGTIASAANAVAKPKSERRGMGDPHYFARGPGGWADRPGSKARTRWPSPQGTWAFDEDTKCWTMPSIMAGINSKVVARSYAMNPERYGMNFRYDESDLCASKTNAILGTLTLGAFGAAFVVPPLRWLMRKTILPKQGEGPSEDTRENGFSHVYVVANGRDANGEAVDSYCCEFEFMKADPGYKGTAALACEAALCLAIPEERARLDFAKEGKGGCFTPSACMGHVLLERLNNAENFSVKVQKLKDTVFLV